jgi:hypothetical protein
LAASPSIQSVQAGPFAFKLHLSVTAEGIEISEQQSHLQALGCERSQGYLFVRPVAADRIPSLLTRHQRSPNVSLLPDTREQASRIGLWAGQAASRKPSDKWSKVGGGPHDLSDQWTLTMRRIPPNSVACGRRRYARRRAAQTMSLGADCAAHVLIADAALGEEQATRTEALHLTLVYRHLQGPVPSNDPRLR